MNRVNIAWLYSNETMRPLPLRRSVLECGPVDMKSRTEHDAMEGKRANRTFEPWPVGAPEQIEDWLMGKDETWQDEAGRTHDLS